MHFYLDDINLSIRVHDTDHKESNARRTVSICSINDQIGGKTEAGFCHQRPRRRLSISSLAAPSKVCRIHISYFFVSYPIISIINLFLIQIILAIFDL